ncbi:MAG: hypothetical protein K0Q59_366, partial [Paenibacillus sp.]|nr:hypothetical protein [Paenibacillus sp.]
FQLVMQIGMAVGPLVGGLLLSVMPLWLCFAVIAVLRLLLFLSRPVIPDHKPGAEEQQSAPLSATKL